VAARALLVGVTVALFLLAARAPAQTRTRLALAERDTVSGQALQRRAPRGPMTRRMAQWEIGQLAALHGQGILDDADFDDAKSKIEAKVGTTGQQRRAAAAGAAAGGRGGGGRQPGARVSSHRAGSLSAKQVAQAQGLIAAMKKLKHNHSVVEKALASPWRQDKKRMREKEALLTQQMAKLEAAEARMKRQAGAAAARSAPSASQLGFMGGAGVEGGQNNPDSVYGYHDDHSTYGVSGSGWQGAGNGETPGDLWSPAVGQRRGAGMSASASGGDAGLGTDSTPLGTLAMMGSFVH
jgi:hypothetical protein